MNMHDGLKIYLIFTKNKSDYYIFFPGRFAFSGLGVFCLKTRQFALFRVFTLFVCDGQVFPELHITSMYFVEITIGYKMCTRNFVSTNRFYCSMKNSPSFLDGVSCNRLA